MNEKAKESFDEYRRRTVKWAIRMEFALLHSIAYQRLNYAPALKVLNWFHEKRSIDVNKKKRGSKRYTVKVQDISFTYAEAALRGLDHKKFNRALRELHAHGFIDVLYLGSGKQRDYSRYALSDRWRTYGTKDFEVIDFPINISYVARDEATKRWIGRPKGKYQRPKSTVGQRPISAVEDAAQRPKSAFIGPHLGEVSTANNGRILSTKPWGVDLKVGSRKKVSAPDLRSQSTSTEKKTYDVDNSYRIATDPKAISDLAMALSSIDDYFSDEGMAKRRRGRPRSNLDPNTAPRLDPDYDPELGPWADDEPMALVGGGSWATH